MLFIIFLPKNNDCLPVTHGCIVIIRNMLKWNLNPLLWCSALWIWTSNQSSNWYPCCCCNECPVERPKPWKFLMFDSNWLAYYYPIVPRWKRWNGCISITTITFSLQTLDKSVIYIMCSLGKFNRLTVWHLPVIYCGSAHIVFRKLTRDWVPRTWFNTLLWYPGIQNFVHFSYMSVNCLQDKFHLWSIIHWWMKFRKHLIKSFIIWLCTVGAHILLKGNTPEALLLVPCIHWLHFPLYVVLIGYDVNRCILLKWH